METALTQLEIMFTSLEFVLGFSESVYIALEYVFERLEKLLAVLEIMLETLEKMLIHSGALLDVLEYVFEPFFTTEIVFENTAGLLKEVNSLIEIIHILLDAKKESLVKVNAFEKLL